MAEHPARENLAQLLDDSLNDDERMRIEGHIEQCPECQQELEDISLGDSGSESKYLLGRQPTNGAPLNDPASEAFFDRLVRMKPMTGEEAPRHGSRTGGIAHLQIDGYEILGELGRGAAGVVYRARHLKLDRMVALKVIVAGPHLSADARVRFRLEALAIARLQHENIVRLYDVGEQDNFPFLSLELAEGGTLASLTAGRPKKARGAARIVATLARAVEYAHNQGVVHRDLKPGNVLLSILPEKPGKRTLKITDFGIAKLSSGSPTSESPMTQTGEILGTPNYMAPEQARGKSSEICPATDVYSLGAILYELLTGRPPFQGATALDTLMQAARRDPVAISLLVPRVPRDLETICLKCLEKETAKRYPTAAELAADLGRFLKNEPIHARPLSWAGHASRWVKRHRGLAAALSAVALLLALMMVGSFVATVYFRASEQRQSALAAEKGRLADEERRLAEEKAAESDKAIRAEHRAEKLQKKAEDEGRQVRKNLYFNQMNLGAQAAALPGAIGRVGEWLEPWRRGEPDLRNWEWYYLDSLCHRDLHTLYAQNESVLCVAWSPNNRRLASGGNDGAVRIWDSIEAREIRPLAAHTREVRTVAWSPDGHRLASASFDGSVKIWNADSGQLLLTFQGGGEGLYTVAWSPDGKRLASGGKDHAIRIWDADTGAIQRVIERKDQIVRDVDWNRRGDRIASCDDHGNVQIWDPQTGINVLSMHGIPHYVTRVAWSPDGKSLASANDDSTAQIWDAQTGANKVTLTGHTLSVISVAWSPDSARLATASDDQTVKVWNAADGADLFALRSHTLALTAVAWSPDGAHLASASWDATVKIWNADAGPEVPVLAPSAGHVFAIAWSPNGRRLASSNADGTIRIWAAGETKEQAILHGHVGLARCVAWSPAGDRLASTGADHTLRIWDASTGRQLHSIPVDAKHSYCVAWSPDGLQLASSDSGRIIHIWDPLSGRELQTCQGDDGPVFSVAWSPDGKRLASGSTDHSVRLWDPSTGKQLFASKEHRLPVKCVAWSADGKRLASASDDETIIIWDATTEKALTTLRGHTAIVTCVAWDPDGSRLASTSEDRTVKIWDSDTGMETLTFNQPDAVRTVAWRPDAVALAAGGNDQKIRIYDASAGYLAEKAPQYLRQLDYRLSVDPAKASDWLLRAQIDSKRGDSNGASRDAQHYLALNPDQHWLALGYWVVGPYPDNLAASYPPETDQEVSHLATGASTDESPEFLPWRAISFSGAGFIDFGALFDHKEHISAYALLRVYSPKEQSVALLLGSDDQIRLWNNGKLIHESLIERPAIPDEDAIAATLKPGWNTLLARVVNVTGPHAMYLRISDSATDRKRVIDARAGHRK